MKRHMPDLMKNNASAVLLEDLTVLKKKLNYFIKIMHVDVDDIVKCKCLGLDLEEIKVIYLSLNFLLM